MLSFNGNITLIEEVRNRFFFGGGAYNQWIINKTVYSVMYKL